MAANETQWCKGESLTVSVFPSPSPLTNEFAPCSINLNVVARILQQFGRLRRLEFVLADARPEVTEGPGETLQISNVMTTVHMHPLAPALADTVSAAAFDQSLYFSVYVQYEQEEGVAAALSKLFGRLLVYEHPMRGKFSVSCSHVGTIERNRKAVLMLVKIEMHFCSCRNICKSVWI